MDRPLTQVLVVNILLTRPCLGGAVRRRGWGVVIHALEVTAILHYSLSPPYRADRSPRSLFSTGTATSAERKHGWRKEGRMGPIPWGCVPSNMQNFRTFTLRIVRQLKLLLRSHMYSKSHIAYLHQNFLNGCHAWEDEWSNFWTCIILGPRHQKGELGIPLA